VKQRLSKSDSKFLKVQAGLLFCFLSKRKNENRERERGKKGGETFLAFVSAFVKLPFVSLTFIDVFLRFAFCEELHCSIPNTCICIYTVNQSKRLVYCQLW